MARSNQRGRNNNNPEGHNQYTNSWTESVKSHPFTSAAVAGAAAAAGAFLWSKRGQISEKAGEMGEKLNSWTEDMRTSDEAGRSPAKSRRSTSTASASSVNRATGDSTNAASKQNMNPARTATPEVSY